MTSRPNRSDAPPPVRRELSVQDLRDLVAEIRAFFEDDQGLVTLALAHDVATELIGHERGAPAVSHALRTGPYFKMESDDEAERVRATFRQLRFAESLFNLQGVEGFHEWIHDFYRLSPEARYTEAAAAGLMVGGGILRRLRRQIGKKGDDYDCDLEIDGVDVACDIKAKIEDTTMSLRTLASTIRDARHQLPEGRPGVVWVKLPQAWFTIPESLALTVEVAMAQIREAPHQLVAVVVHWEEFRLTSYAARFRVHGCAASPSGLKLAESLRAGLLSAISNPMSVRFDALVSECLTAADPGSGSA